EICTSPETPSSSITGSARRTDFSNFLPWRDDVAFMHADSGQVGQEREQSEPVIEDDGVSGEVQISGEDDAARAWRADGRAGRTREIGAAVRASSLTVEDAPRAETAGGHAGDRRHETIGP